MGFGLGLAGCKLKVQSDRGEAIVSPNLDAYSPAAVYALRQRMSSYSSNLVRVRRSSDNAEQDFGMIDGLLDSASIVSWLSGATGYLTTVYDQIGSNNLIQANTSKQPTLNLSGGYPTIQISDTNSHLLLTTRLTDIKTAFVTLLHSTGTAGNYPPILGDSSAYDFASGDGTALFDSSNIPVISAGQFYINGVATAISANKPTSLTQLSILARSGTLTVGNVSNDRINFGRSWVGQFADIILFSADKVLQRGSIEQSTALCYGLSLTGQSPSVETQTVNLIFDGNSFTEYNIYPPKTIQSLPNPPYKVITTVNYGVAGQTTAQMLADFASQVNIAGNLDKDKNIVVMQEGINDIYFGASATTAYNNIVAYCQAARTAGFKVVVTTLTPRQNVGTPSNQETDRLTVNTNIRANWATFADALADWGGDAIMGQYTTCANTTYYADLVHPTTLGYAIISLITANAINTLLL